MSLARSYSLFLILLISLFPFSSPGVEPAPTPTQIGYAPLKVPNACLPDSIGFRSAYQVHEANLGNVPWSRLLLVYQRVGKEVRAHAYCVFLVEGKLWTYDQVCGSQRAWVDLSEKNDASKLGHQLAARNFVRAAWLDSML